MSHCRSSETLTQFAAFITRNMGLCFSGDRLPDLAQRMAVLGKQAGYTDIDKYLRSIMSAPLSRGHLETLARALTIGETYFLRDPRSYQVLEQELLPELIASRRATDKTLRIWSAGCSTGEEPYSVAILLSRAICDLASWKITLFGTDINPLALERGRRGVYSQWSFRNAPPWLIDYFTRREDGLLEIMPRIRKMVQFSHLNLADDRVWSSAPPFAGIDIIFCRNVMLYFDTAEIKKTMARFHEALRDGGYLFVGPTEVNHHAKTGFSCRHYDGAFVLSKVSEEQDETGPRPLTNQPDQKPAAPAQTSATLPGMRQHTAPAEPATPQVTLPDPGSLFGPTLPGEIESGADETPGADGFAEAGTHYQAGRYQEAADLALRSLEAGEKQQASALALAARSYANIGRFIEARECCEKAISCNRLGADNHYLLSIILEQQGDTEGAIGSLKNALFIDHDYLLAYFAQGNLYRKCGKQRESERSFANALRLLEQRNPHEVIEEADGMTAGSLAQMIRGMSAESGGQGVQR